MTQKIRKLCVRPYIITESLCHINTYWLFLLAERAKRKSDLTLKMKSHKKCELQSPPVKSNKLSYHGRHYNTSWNPMIWACDKNDIWHCQRHFQSTIRDLRKFALSQLFILWLSTHIFNKFTLEFIFMCYLHLIIICYAFELLPSLLFLVLIAKFISYTFFCITVRDWGIRFDAAQFMNIYYYQFYSFSKSSNIC